MRRVDGKVAIVTGGGRGMGAEQARLLAREGAKVVIGVRDQELGKEVAESILESGGEATWVHLEVTDEEEWLRAVELAETRYGGLNVLVNNAGVHARGTVEETSEEVWDQVMDVNLKGVFLGTKHAIPAMRRAGGGSIINIGSAASIAPTPAGSPAYPASKGGVRVFTKATAIQHAGDNIRCNVLHPGATQTGMMRTPMSTEALSRLGVPLMRVGTPLDMAYGVLFLASDESSYMTGSELVIDGGRTAH